MLLLDHGIVRATGRPDEVIASYMNLLNTRILGRKGFGSATSEPAIEIMEVDDSEASGRRAEELFSHP